MLSLKKNYLKKQIFALIGLFSIVLFSAFGCKQDDAAKKTDEAASDQPKVTYEVPKENGQATDVKPDGQINQGETQGSTDNQDKTKTEDQKGALKDEEKEIILTQAGKIVEIYGTFTNKESEAYKNLKDLDVYATKKLKDWIQTQTSKPQDQGDAFYGMTTKVLSSVVLESSQNSAKILVTTRREEIVESRQEPRVFYALIEVLMVKEEDQWKVDGLYWKK